MTSCFFVFVPIDNRTTGARRKTSIVGNTSISILCGAALFSIALLVLPHFVGGETPNEYELRTFDGTGNNEENPEWGSVGSTQVLKQTIDRRLSYLDPPDGEEGDRHRTRAMCT